MKSAKIAQRLTLKVKRPSGKTEFVIHPSLKSITEVQFKQIQKDTKKANGSEVISYKINYEYKSVMTTKSEIYAARFNLDSTVDDMSRMGE